MFRRKKDPESVAFWERVDAAAEAVKEFADRQREYARAESERAKAAKSTTDVKAAGSRGRPRHASSGA